ncbi:MAG TPA: hypothetical protein PKH65_10775 [Bacteroidia bacterium]|nr:hypothetical protein [Bacteroidia bacterium]
MIIRFFTGNQLITWILLPIIAITLWLWAATSSFPLYYDSPMILYQTVVSWLEQQPRYVVLFISFSLLFSQSLHLNYVLRINNVLYKKSHVPALVYLFVMSFAPPLIGFHPLLIVNSILIIILSLIFKLYKQIQPMRLDFDISFLIGFATLFYFPVIFLYLIYLISLAMIATFNWRDIAISIIGLLFPYFFVVSWIIIFSPTGFNWSDLWYDTIPTHFDPSALLLSAYQISFYFMVILFTIGLIRLGNNFYKNVTQTRRYQQIVLLLTIFASLSIMYSVEYGMYRYCLLSIPITVVLSYLFISGSKKWLNETVFILFIALICYNYWLG